MKVETFKTTVLTILVLISLLLTSALWDYQPYHKSGTQSKYVNEVDLGGREETKSTIVTPEQIVFKKDENHYGFSQPVEMLQLYEQMQKWGLDNFRSFPVEGARNDSHRITITFPTELPVEIVKYLFTLNEDVRMPSWSFKYMFITFDKEDLRLYVNFPSIDGQQQVQFVVNDTNIYKRVWSYMQEGEGLIDYLAFETDQMPIYIPRDKIELKSHSLAVNTISPNLLISALFSDPSLVNPNYSFGEIYYNDGQRGMRILQEGRNMEFINPIHANDGGANTIDLLDWSLQSINTHKGWTDTYRLSDVNIKENAVTYRMYYNEYPVFNKADLSIIEQKVLNQDVHLYKRPLFSVVNSFSSNQVTLSSGKKVAHYLANSSHYQRSHIQDIKIGYKLTYVDRSTHTISLDPVWYMKYNGIWSELRIEDQESMGGS